MRWHVNSRMYLLRKKIDGLLNILFPTSWVPLYTMVGSSNKLLNRLFKSITFDFNLKIANRREIKRNKHIINNIIIPYYE